MRVKPDANSTVTAKLTDILNETFPHRNATGIASHLNSIKNDPDSKGKSVFFTWKKTSLRLTENLKVKEIDFTNSLVESEVAKEAEAQIAYMINHEEAESHGIDMNDDMSEIVEAKKEPIEVAA